GGGGGVSGGGGLWGARGWGKRWRPSASVWSAPTTNRPLMPAHPARAFSRASSEATSAAVPAPARRSTARSSMSAGAISSGTPAASSMARRTAPPEASTTSWGALHRDMSVHRLATALAQQGDHGGGGLLDRPARHVDDRPVVLGAQPPREGDLLSHRLAIDVLIVVTVGLEAEQPVLADRHDPFRARGQSDDERLLYRLELRRDLHSGHQRDVRGLDAAVGEIDRGGRLRRARDA